MRRLTILFVLLSLFVFQSSAAVTQKDSLHAALRHAEGEQRLKILRNLADMTYDRPDEKSYLTALCAEAAQQKNIEMLNGGIYDLFLLYISESKPDSAKLCIDRIGFRSDDKKERDRLVCYLNLRLFETMFVTGDGNAEVEEKLISIKSRQNDNIYTKIEFAYCIGITLFDRAKEIQSIPYFETALELAEKLPPDEFFWYAKDITRKLAVGYTKNNENSKAISVIERTMEMQEKYYAEVQKKGRIYFPANSYRMRNYAMLVSLSPEQPVEKLEFYIRKMKELHQNNLSASDNYNYYRTVYNYYTIKRDFKTASGINDTLIGYAKTLAPYNLSNLYLIHAKLYSFLDDYKNAYLNLETSCRLKDSLDKYTENEQLLKLQVEYDLHKLNYEKSRLEIRNKQILLLCIVVFLLLVIVLCGYLYYNLKKEKRMKAAMTILKEKAIKSEQLKSAFINSICHEIRTPLNAVTGFAQLAFEENLSQEERVVFRQEILNNTNLLTTLVNSMLEVSILDISDERLPLQPVDINSICDHCMELLLASKKERIRYDLELPQESIIIPSNYRYLSMVIDNLLNNANKFTEQGSIGLTCFMDHSDNRLVIKVTDTGCGIPAEKHNEVFERFIKLDEYKQGSGLGLYLCRLIITRLNGEIYIDNTYTGGTRIIVKLPVSADA